MIYIYSRRRRAAAQATLVGRDPLACHAYTKSIVAENRVQSWGEP